jgi:hypothetical protein
MDTADVARLVVNALSDRQCRRLAELYAQEVIDDVRRADARAIEYQAQRQAAEAAAEEARRQAEQARVEQAQQTERTQIEVWEDYRDHPRVTHQLTWGRRALRNEFRRWMGDDFDEWLDGACEQVQAETPERIDAFEAAWDPDGYMHYYNRRAAEMLATRVQELLDEQAAQIRLELTREFLASPFDVERGGETTTWGAATVAQHERRSAYLAGMAGSTLETAARHQAAVNMIREHGATCLAEVAATPTDGLRRVTANSIG